MLRFLFGNPLKAGRPFAFAVLLYFVIYAIAVHEHYAHPAWWGLAWAGVAVICGLALGGGTGA
jgi:hypothetical protein